MNPFAYFTSPAYTARRVSPTGLAVFRIFYSMILFWEAWQIFRYREFIFDPAPYRTAGEFTPDGAFIFWMVAIVALLVGWQTRLAAAVNYGFSMFTFAAFHEYEYHYDFVAHATNFLLLFSPVSETLSVDAWLKRRAERKSGAPREESGVHPIYYQLHLLFGVGLIYFDSVIWKLSSPAWQQGTAIWNAMSAPAFTWYPVRWFQFMLNEPSLMLVADWLTLFLEFAFIILMWSQRCRTYILLPIGIILHVGIFLSFPIPKFALGMIVMYILAPPPSWWDAAFRLMKSLFSRTKKQLGTALQQLSEQPLTTKSYNRRWVLHSLQGLVCLALCLQTLIILHYHHIIPTGIYTTTVKKSIVRTFGINTHGVFIDHHWSDYNHIIAVVHARPDGSYHWLPFTTPDGQMGSFALDRFWANWAFRCNAPRIKNKTIEKTIKSYIGYWVVENLMHRRDNKFLVLTKALEPCYEWRPDELTRRMSMPWQVAGEITWHKSNRDCTLELADIQSLKPLDPSTHPLIPELPSPYAKELLARGKVLRKQQVKIIR